MIGGIHLEGKKEASLLSWTIRRASAPAKVFLPLQQSSGGFSIPCVASGTHVRIGEKVAEAGGTDSVCLHASISGVVSEISSFPHPLFGESLAIEIISDQQGEKAPTVGQERNGWQSLSFDEILEIFRDSGLVDLSPRMTPLHQKAAVHRDSEIPVLILNGCESEPYLTADHALMMSHPVEILKGAEILRRVTGTKEIVIGIERNKLEVAELLKSKIYFLKWDHCHVQIFPTRYPQGGDQILACEILKDPVTSFSQDIGTEGAVYNIATAMAIYEAVVLQKPFYERTVTVGGECVVEPKNLWIPVGMVFGDAIKKCRGLLREPRKLLMGGPMTGIAQSTLEVPVIKGTQAVLALPKEVAAPVDITDCFRCGRCIDVCPVRISPAMIALASEYGAFDVAREYGSELCLECGNCAYVCPAKRPMVELIRSAKITRDLDESKSDKVFHETFAGELHASPEVY